MRREPVRQAMILPGGQQVSHDQATQLEGFMEKAFAGCRSHGEYQKAEDDPVRNAHGSRIRMQMVEFNDTSARGLNLQLASRQLTVCLEVLFACPQRNFLGEGWRGRLLVPANFFKVVPYILLIVGILRLARLI